MYPTISIGGILDIPLYSILFLAGVLTAVLAARRLAHRAGLPKEDVTYGTVYAFIGILVGAKFVYLLTKLPALLSVLPDVGKSFEENFGDTLWYLVNFLLGGYVYYGGLIGAVLGVYCYCRRYKVDFLSFMDVFAPWIPFVHGVGRIGCFCAGCCYGIEYHGFGSVQFPYNRFIPGLDDVPRVPVQLMEAGLNFAFWGVMLFLFLKKEIRGGKLLGIYLIYYAIVRFALEMLRGDKIRGGVGIFSTSQLISVILLPIGIVLLTGKWRRFQTKKS